MDDDGLEIGKKVPIKVRVEKRGDEMTIDLSEVSRQVRGFYNSGVTTGIACAQVAFQMLDHRNRLSRQRRSFRNLKVIMPMGRVISAERPFPMRRVDDLSDDSHRHRLQGVRQGHSRPHHCRTSCGPGLPKHSRHFSCRRQIVHRRNWPTGRGLGCEKE